MAPQNENLARLQAALTQLSAPPPTAGVLYPGTERYSLITFLLQKLLSPELVNTLQQRAAEAELPNGISAEEAQAHRLARVLQTVDFHASADQVRGCTTPDEALHLLVSLASLAAAHQQHLQDAAAATSASSSRAPSPGPLPSSLASHAPSPTPRQRTPSRQGYGGSGGGSQDGGAGGGGGRLLLGLHSVEGELRTLESLVDRLPVFIEPNGGSNWFPGDIMASLQPYLQENQSMSELAATVEQRAQKLRDSTPALRAEVNQLATEVTVANEAEWLQQAESTRAELATLLETSASFFQTFQTGLGVWCAASRAADTCGLGPMASEFLQRYEALRSLGTGLARVRQAYNSVVSCAPPLTLLDQHTLSQLVHAGQTAVEQAHARMASIQRLLTEAEAETQRAAVVMRSVALSQPQPAHA